MFGKTDMLLSAVEFSEMALNHGVNALRRIFDQLGGYKIFDHGRKSLNPFENSNSHNHNKLNLNSTSIIFLGQYGKC